MVESEVEFSTEDDDGGFNLPLQDLSQAVLWGTDWTVETVLAQLQRGNIELNPQFQRRDAWNRTAKSRFVESVILGLPIPQVVLAESREHRGRYIILDGKQRLLSLMQFAGYAEGQANGFRLSGLEVREDLLRKRYRNLEREPALRPDFNAFLTHTIRTVVIRNWPSLAFLHVVFQRLNTGSLKLSPQELRQALASGPFTEFADDTTIRSQETSRLLGRSSPDPRMRDVELLVRAVSFKLRLTQYEGRMKEFLDASCAYFNKHWKHESHKIETTVNDFKEGIVALEKIFGEGKIARKLHSSLFNRSIFDALIYYAMSPEIRSEMVEKIDDVKAAYDGVLRDERFQIAVESDTAGIPHTAERLHLWGAVLAQVLSHQVSIPQIFENAQGQQRFAI